MDQSTDKREDYYQLILTALAIWREARGASSEAKFAVACVIRNRTKDERWPDTYARVILEPAQFSSFNAKDPNAVKFPLPEDQSWQQALEAASYVMGESAYDPSHGANHYESIDKAELRPKWCDAKKIVARIGPFRFYRL